MQVGILLSPPSTPERLADLGPKTVHEIQVSGRGWLEAACDVVVSGLGWFSVTGVGPCTLRVLAPQGTMVLQRDPLMPYEAKSTMAKATGGRILKNQKKAKTPG